MASWTPYIAPLLVNDAVVQDLLPYTWTEVSSVKQAAELLNAGVHPAATLAGAAVVIYSERLQEYVLLIRARRSGDAFSTCTALNIFGSAGKQDVDTTLEKYVLHNCDSVRDAVDALNNRTVVWPYALCLVWSRRHGKYFALCASGSDQ